jgi:phosphoglycerate dehydrogenase-like enzyme
MTMTTPFRIGLTADFQTEAAGLLEPILPTQFGGLPQIGWEFMPTPEPAITPEQLNAYDAVIALALPFTAASLAGVERLAVIARWGVGYDMIDTQACTENDVLLCITRDAVRKPVAEGIITLLLALAKHMPAKDRLVRGGRWADKNDYPGLGISGRTLGSIGVGNIGAELFRMLRPFDLRRMLAYDPYVSKAQAAALGVTMVDLDTLLAESDFVCINCPLTKETFHLLDEARLRRMKPSAFLINTARGPIVDQAALTRALQERWIAGAALDVFEREPLPADDPLTQLDNVILSPHAIAWTDDLVRGNGEGACQNILTVLRGEVPAHSVNREVVERPGFRAKLRALRERWHDDKVTR